MLCMFFQSTQSIYFRSTLFNTFLSLKSVFQNGQVLHIYPLFIILFSVFWPELQAFEIYC